MRIVLYGAGEAAEPYLRVLARRRDVELAAVCDGERHIAEREAGGWRARVYDQCQWPAMLAEMQPDAAWICVPPALQGEIVVHCAQQGIPFFILPPGAIDISLARKCAQAVAQRRLVTAVAFPARFIDIVREARAFLGERTVPLALGQWLHRPVADDVPGALSALWNEGAALVDVMIYFNGAVAQVRALGVGSAAGGLQMQLDFHNGSAGTIICSTFARPEPRIELELLAEDVSITFENDFAALQLAEADKTTILRRLNRPVDEMVAAFLHAAGERDPAAVVPGYADALHVMAVCAAAARSCTEKRVVEVGELMG